MRADAVNGWRTPVSSMIAVLPYARSLADNDRLAVRWPEEPAEIRMVRWVEPGRV